MKKPQEEAIDLQPSEEQSSGLSRRDVLKSTAALAVATGTGAGLGMFGGKAPAFAQSRTINVVAWSHFIPDCDKIAMPEFAAEFEKATKVKVALEFINANDITPRATAAVESKTGPDIFQFQWNQPWVYQAGLIDHAKLVQELHIEKFYKYLQEGAHVGKVWRGVPYYSIGNAYVYRKDWYQEAGFDPNKPGQEWTYDLHLKAGAALKKNGHPIGFSMGHSFGDPPTNCYPLLWAFGGREVDEKGKVAINSKETREAIKYFVEFWNAACDPTGLSWDDSSNNRAFYAETISATLNGASIYVQSKKGQQRPDLKDKMGHYNNPLGPKGRYHVILNFSHSITRYSKQQGAAADWIRFLHQPSQYARYIHIQAGYGLGGTPDWEKDPMWDADPTLAAFRSQAKYGRTFGWAGAFNRASSEVQAKYLIVDMFANAVQGKTVEETIAQTEKEMKLVYERT